MMNIDSISNLSIVVAGMLLLYLFWYSGYMQKHNVTKRIDRAFFNRNSITYNLIMVNCPRKSRGPAVRLCKLLDNQMSSTKAKYITTHINSCVLKEFDCSLIKVYIKLIKDFKKGNRNNIEWLIQCNTLTKGQEVKTTWSMRQWENRFEAALES